MRTKMKQFLVGFLVCALLLGAYPVSAYGTELPPSTEENVEENENIENPEDGDNTGDSEEPGDTETPGDSENPEDTETPDDSENPEDTETPDDDESGDAEAPEDSEESEEKNWVVVLDPGHGGADGGASRTFNGVTYVERDLALKIALYCKAELEKYENVVVYMTRTDNTSPGMDRQQRAYYAASVGADVLVSLHLNATSSSVTYSQTGAEAYYPNSNYKTDISNAGWHMSSSILWELQSMGIPNNGCKNRYTEDNTLYPDGTKGDYLGINYWSKMYGFPGILIEHAYINNPNDVANFLSTEQGLMLLGIADARGIINSLNSGEFVYEKGFAGRWLQESNGKWWFEYATGGWPADQWLNLWGTWYYFDAEGYMAYGWQYIDGDWYYLGGADDGAMRTGWQNLGGVWYYLGGANDGAMKYGWQWINGSWYYLGASNDGAMRHGWQWIDNDWYYLGASNDGAMKTGWQKIGGYWYYMYASGNMAYNAWIDNYYVNASGAWVATR